MPTLQALRHAIDQLSQNELTELRISIQQREKSMYAVHSRSPEEQIALL